jgi:transcriptional regulator with XRE-family HTH domain
MTQGIGAYHSTIEPPAAPGFGAALRAMRLRGGMSRGQLARLTDCDRSTFSRIESGSRKASPEMVIHLADTFGLTGAMRCKFLSIGGVIETPLTDAQAAYLAGYNDRFTGRYSEAD